MNNKMAAGVVLMGAIVMVIAGRWPPSVENRQLSAITPLLPWRIEHTAAGLTTVLGITLGRSKLVEAEGVFNSEDEVSLFAAPNGKLSIEGYFDSVSLAGLDARIIAVVDVPTDQLKAIYNRGARISTLEGGTRKVSLSSVDLLQIRNLPIISLTYMPKIKLEPAQLERRFGKPKVLVKEPGNDVTHWLYPDQGLDIILGSGLPVLQYVLPRNFYLLQKQLTQ